MNENKNKKLTDVVSGAAETLTRAYAGAIIWNHLANEAEAAYKNFLRKDIDFFVEEMTEKYFIKGKEMEKKYGDDHIDLSHNVVLVSTFLEYAEHNLHPGFKPIFNKIISIRDKQWEEIYEEFLEKFKVGGEYEKQGKIKPLSWIQKTFFLWDENYNLDSEQKKVFDALFKWNMTWLPHEILYLKDLTPFKDLVDEINEEMKKENIFESIEELFKFKLDRYDQKRLEEELEEENSYE